MTAEAWVTLATNDSYALGALVLAHSLRRVGTTRRLVALITPGVTNAMKDQLVHTFDLVETVNVLDSGDTANLALLSRPDLGVTFTKLHCWRLTQFSKCVFLDADTLVLQPCDELFDREELSAAPDAGWPDCFNSGVFVYRPSNETYAKLIEFGVSHGSFDGGDQGLLNSFFSDWATRDISRHLPFIYNMCSSAVYSYLPAFKKFGETVRIAHFIGSCKPWMQTFDSETQQVRVDAGLEHQKLLLQLWWDIFCKNVHPHLSRDMGGLAAAFSQMTLGAPKSEAQLALEEHLRRDAWERGQIDYLGKDSFDNVWQKIMQTLTSVSTAPAAQPPPPPPPPTKAKSPSPPRAPVAPPPAPPSPVVSEPVAPTPAAAVPAPAAPEPAVPSPAVPAPAVPAPVAPAPEVSVPVAPAPVAPAPVAPAPEVSAPIAPAPKVPAPVVPAPVAPAPEVPAPVAPAPAVPAPAVPAPAVPEPVAPAPVVPSPAVPEPKIPDPIVSEVPLASPPAKDVVSTPPPPSAAPTQPVVTSPPPPPVVPVAPQPTEVIKAPEAKSPTQKEAPPSAPAPAAAKTPSPKGSPTSPPPEEAGAQGAAPVAPKRKGGQQQQGGRGGKSGGQKGKK